jgi:hypothetical protein
VHEHLPADRGSSSHLTSATHRTLEIALRPTGTPDTQLQDAMRDLCSAARQQGMRAEELIVLFKKTWSERPELRGMSREETGRLFDSVVTMCVDEFYDADR